jgi:hypothetical protein
VSDPRGPDAPGMSAEERVELNIEQRAYGICVQLFGCPPNPGDLQEHDDDACQCDIFVSMLRAGQADAERRAQEAEREATALRERLAKAEQALADVWQELTVCNWHCDVCGADPEMLETDLAYTVRAYRASAPGGSSHE